MVDDEWDVKFCMGLILVCFYKFDEVLLGDFKNVGMEILEVYGY